MMCHPERWGPHFLGGSHAAPGVRESEVLSMSGSLLFCGVVASSMFCPVCESEFSEGITHCPQDDIDLVEELPKGRQVPTRSTAERIRDPIGQHRILIAPTLADAYLPQALLASEGIDAMVRGEHLVVATRGGTVRVSSRIGMWMTVSFGEVFVIRPHPDVRRWQLRGTKHLGKAQGRPLHTGATGKGKTGRVSASDTLI